VLEAMAMARPVLLTPGAATGIDAVDGVHFAVEDSDERLVARALGLLGDPSACKMMGAAARRLVIDTLSWPAMLAPLRGLLGREARGEERRDAA
jgi:hypothetical protein